MAKRGRTSSAEARVRVIDGGLNKRPDPTDDLTERQAEIWRETVSSEPADWFGTAALRSMLADYCRHREASENVSKVLNMFQSDWLKNAEGAKRYKELLKMRERIAPLAKPYPKRDKQAMTGDHPEQRQGSTDRHAPDTDEAA